MTYQASKGKEYENIGNSPVNPVNLAVIAHQANQAYCDMMGDETVPAPDNWESIPQANRDGIIEGVKFVLANPNAGDSAQHDNWRKQRISDGWKYGKIKCETKKEHPNLVDFDQLSPTQQFKDKLFRSIVLSALN